MQLPPINERISPTFIVKNMYQLTEILRQEESNPMLALFKLLRHDIPHGTSTFLNHIARVRSNVNDIGEGYTCMTQNEFIPAILSDFKSKAFKKSSDHIRYGGWTREITKDWNRYLREEIVGTGDVIKEGDLLTGHKTIVDEFFDPILINSEDYIVRKCERRMSEDGFAFYRVFADAVTSKNKNGTNEVYFNVVDHLDPSYERFKRKLIILYSNIWNSESGRPKLWKRYYEFKDMYLILNKIDIPMSNGSVKTIPNEIDYGYGLTIHKLQGSTLNTIAINLIDICHWGADKNRPIYGKDRIEDRNKLIYTALSRATSNAKLFV